MEPLTPPVTIALAGLGDVALQHQRAIDQCEVAQLRGVWTRDPDKLTRLATQWQVRAYPEYDDLLADDEVHVVDITAADTVHLDFALRALAAGKHVIIEKPPAESASQVRQLQSAAAESGLQCIPMHNYVYRPRMLQARQLVRSGELGGITSAFFSEVMCMPEEWATHYDGVLVTAMYHLLYSSLFLLGPPDRIFAQQESLHYTRCRDDDLTTLLLHYSSGAMAVLLGNWTANDLTTNSWFSLYKLIGTKGGVNISGHDALVYEESGWGSLRWPDYEDTFVHALNYLVRRCLLEGEPPASGLDHAATTMRMVELAQQSARENVAVPFAAD